MRILVVADEESKYIWEHFDREVFAGVELVLSCGDLKRTYLEFLATLIPAPLYFVHGNHDESFLEEPPGGCLSLEDRVVEYRGKRFAGLGGCKSGNPYARCEFSERAMSKRAGRLSRRIRRAGGLDVLVTHAPAEGLGDGDDAFHKGFDCFRNLLEDFAPAYHFFGHQHARYGMGPTELWYRDTRLYNACGYRLMDI